MPCCSACSVARGNRCPANYICECAVQNDSLATLLARLEGILGPVPQRLLAQGRYTHRYYTVSGALFERNPRTVSAHLPSPCFRGEKDC